VLLVGVEPWGAAAAADLAAAGIGVLHLLDDQPVTVDDLASMRCLTRASLGRGRASAVCASLSRANPACAITAGRITLGEDCSLALDDARWDLILACLPGDDLQTLQAVARLAERIGAPSLSAHLDGLDAVMGPAVLPGKTACWECCRLRRLATAADPDVEHALQATLLSGRGSARAHTYLPAMPGLLGHALAAAALELLSTTGPHVLHGRLSVQNLVTLEAEIHTVLPMPHCQVCGGAFARGCARPEGDGRDMARARTPEDLRQMLAGVVDRRTGIITRLIVNPSGSAIAPELPVAASALLSRYTEGGATPRCCGPEIGSGKGTTNVGALVSAVGEAVERYSAARIHPAALVRASLAQMSGDFLAPADLCTYAEHQLDEPGFPFPRLSPELPLEWARGFWLDTGAPVLVPALPVYFNYHAPPGAHFCEVTSNGLAAGPTLAAAALSAALELCERDAFMLAWLARRPGRRVSLDDSISAEAREAVRQLKEQGVRVEVVLLEVGVEVPAVACVGYGDGERWPGAAVSLAADLDPRAAIAKAIFEQAHLGPYLCRLVAEGRRAIPERPEDVRDLEDHALYYLPKRRADALAFLGSGGVTAASDLRAPKEISAAVLCRRLAPAGLRIAVVDVTSPDLAETPIRVARALGAGFQQIHFGHRLARLGNPRLLAMATHGINPDPHPMA
jgi:ribosomal protein S12 methylthiotransferase accessory factor